MKKIIAILAIGTTLVACNNAAETSAASAADSAVAKVDSAVTATADSAKSTIDSTAKAVVDSAKSKIDSAAKKK